MMNETCHSAVVAQCGKMYMIYLTSRLIILEVLYLQCLFTKDLPSLRTLCTGFTNFKMVRFLPTLYKEQCLKQTT